MAVRSTVAACLAAVCLAAPARAQAPLTVDRLLDLVARQNPDVLLARARVLEARGALRTAEARLAANPEVDAFVGTSDSGTTRNTELEFSVVQRFEIGGQRRARMESASAGIEQRSFEAGATVLDAQTLALGVFYRAEHAAAVGRLADDQVALAEEALGAARARYRAGETAVLDVNLARVEVARAQRARLSATARWERALGDLRELLALPVGEALAVSATLQAPSVPPLDTLLAALADRPDVKALVAGHDRAEADLRLAEAIRRPDLAGGFTFRREGGQPAAGGRFGMAIPLFQRQNGAVASATARASAARLATQARRQALDTRLRTRHAQYLAAAEAADLLAQTALPLLQENESLTRESYQAGKIGLLDLLVISRESFAARREALDATLAAALAAVDVRGVAGVLR